MAKRKGRASQKEQTRVATAVPTVKPKANGESAGKAPKRDSRISVSGIVKIPMARLAVKSNPTKASTGRRLLASNHQITTAARSSVVMTPQKGSTW
ncbi:hypothetical protein D3C72_2345890 [compost metagenome]